MSLMSDFAGAGPVSRASMKSRAAGPGRSVETERTGAGGKVEARVVAVMDAV
jgi:hypothetical protein